MNLKKNKTMTSMEGKPGKLMVGRKRKPDDLWHALREAQRKCGCNTKTLNTIRQAVQPFCKDEKKQETRADRKLCNFANAVLLELHGCVRCHDFVFSPKDFALRCPKCGHPRFDRKKQPNEVFYYFPLKSQLEVMLRNSQYRHLLLHEARRRKKKVSSRMCTTRQGGGKSQARRPSICRGLFSKFVSTASHGARANMG